MHLEELGYFASEGDGGRPIDTARRNFSRGSLFVTQTILVSKDDPRIDIYSLDHDLSLGACERGAAETLDEWEWCDDAHGADELTALEIPSFLEFAAPEAEKRDQPNPVIRHAHGRYYVTDGARFGAWCATEAGAWAAWANSNNLLPLAESEADTPPRIFAGGASYTPIELSDKPYTGSSRQYMTYEQRAELVRESMRRRPDADKPLPPGVIDLLVPGDPDADDPLVRCPPTEPKAQREYWSLKKKKASSPAQARWMRRRIAELEVLVPLSEWGQLPAGRDGRWLQADGTFAPAHKLPAAGRASIQQGAFL
jgi:hypothetical protein